MPPDCIDDNDAAQFVSGSLDDGDRARIEEHVDGCASCRTLLAELARQSLAARPPETLLPAGTTVGRYVIGGVLGAGAMGVVYSAEDPQLGRHVALKLLRPRAADGGSGATAGEARLLAEAHALAQLAHPNVVTVFDAGQWQDRVFIALELVRGGTLGEWLFGGRHTLSEVLAHFRAAGAGLAAAHAAGIVHRDFKPDNVLVGDDGRARVTDFGLALAGAETSDPGALAGTPAYMAPEQRTGSADARSDQYAFAVSLWEALYGGLPGAAPRGPGVGKVPRRIRRAVERGLSRDPEARHPSLAALVAALAWDPLARRRRLLAGALLALLTAAIVLLQVRSSTVARVCRSGAERFARVVDPQRWRTTAPRAAARDPLSLEAEAQRRDRVAQLDDYHDRWVALYSDACTATRVRGDQSDELMELRMSCLEARLQGVEALVEILERNDPVVQKRLAGREVLEPLEPCSDRAALLAPLRPPRDRQTRERVESTRAALGRVRVLDNAGEYQRARQQATQLLGEARAIGYAPLVAEALLRLATAEEHAADPAAERDFLDAALTGEAAHHDQVVAAARTHLLWVVAVRNGHADQADRLAREAEAAIARGGDDDSEVLLLDVRAGLAEDPEAAIKLYERLITRLEKRTGRARLRLGQTENNLATVYLDSGRPAEALPHFDRAISIEEPILGAHHPAVLLVRRNRLEAQGSAGHMRDVVAAARALLADTEAAVGPDHVDAGYGQRLYGLALADAPKTRRESVAPLSRALAIFEAKLPADGEAAAEVHGVLCDTLVALARIDEARPHCAAILAFAEKQPGHDAATLRAVLVSRAELLLATGESAQARAALERALALAPEGKWATPLLATARFALARALWAEHGDRTRARKLAGWAQASFTKSGDEEQSARVRAWLAAR